MRWAEAGALARETPRIAAAREILMDTP
jgi:hypothetical protein